MNLDRRLIIGAGAALALAAGLAIAFVVMKREPAPSTPPPASQGGLVVESGRDDDLKLDPKRPLRCFVNGQFVGELPLAVCAQRNGVATGALDVGIDPSGALAATNGLGGAQLTPLPPRNAAPSEGEAPPSAGDEGSPQAGGPGPQAEAAGRDCWRYGPGGWRQLPTPLGLQACVSALFAGRCQGRNQAAYGRWGEATLRLTDGRIEISSDNRDFSSLVDPWPPCVAGNG